jgi:ABC-type uncharacterized transport system permease subunit
MKNTKIRKSAASEIIFRAARSSFRSLTDSPFLSFLVALVLGGIIIEVVGHSAVQTYIALFKGAFSSWRNFVITLTQMTPVIFTGLSYTIANKVGLINLGMEGQLLGGAMGAALVGLYLPDQIACFGPVPAILAAGIVGGCVAFIPAFLNRILSSNEMLISLMLNYVVSLMTIYLVNYVVQTPDNITPATSPVRKWAELTKLVPGTQLSTGLLIALALVFLLWFFLYKTGAGFMVRAVGLNRGVSEFKGINAKQYSMMAFVIAGCVAGIGGAVQVLGVHGNFIQGMSPGYGFDGMAAALLGGLEPVGLIFGSLVFGAMRSGSIYLSRTTTTPADFIYVIEGLLILFIATPSIIRRLLRQK